MQATVIGGTTPGLSGAMPATPPVPSTWGTLTTRPSNGINGINAINGISSINGIAQTVIPNDTPAKAQDPVRSAPHTAHNTAPSVVPGLIRKAVEVSLPELEKQFPGTPQAVLCAAQSILRNTVFETLSSVACSQWGIEALQRYQDMVGSALTQTSAPALRDGIQHLQRMYQLLAELAQVLQKSTEKNPWFWTPAASPWDAFQKRSAELQAIGQHLENTLPTLRSMQTDIEHSTADGDQLLETVHAYSLAAQWLAEHFASDSRAPHLFDQAIRLTRSLSQIQEGLLLRQTHSRDIDVLADKIQDGVLIVLPGWIDRFHLLYSRQNVTPTDTYTLHQGLSDLLNRLQ